MTLCIYYMYQYHVHHGLLVFMTKSGIGAALGQLGWWSGTLLMGEVGPVLLSSPLQTPGTFYLFGGLYVLAILHVLFLLPETKVCDMTPTVYWMN